MRIVLDPDELNRFAAFAVEAADDHGTRADRLGSHELPTMPDEIASAVADGLARVVDDLTTLSANLYAEALMLRARSAALDPSVRPHLMRGLSSLPG